MPIDPDNLAFWNAVAPQHVASPLYRTADFRAGQVVIDPVAREALGDVAGQRLLHLQCHFGLDTLSLARLGAAVTGLDFSAPAIDQARTLAAEANLGATFPWPALASLVKLDRDYWTLPEGVPWVPLSFTLEAVKG